MQARNDLMNLITGHPPTRVSNVNIDPFYHQHLQQRAAQQLRDEYGVHVVFPEETEDSPELVLVYEGPMPPSEYQMPRRAPTAAETKQFQRGLGEAEEYLKSLIGGGQELVNRDVEAHPKFHDKIRRYVNREQETLSEDQIPVQLRFPQPAPQAARRPAGGLSMRGPSNAVEDLMTKLVAFIEQEEKDELERSFTTSFDFPQKFANFLIGKRGENIRKLREEFDVEIQVNDGKVELKGPEAKCAKAKSHILAMGKKLEDETTIPLKVEPQYHKDLIGPKGSQVNRLQERYNVRINFPRSANAHDENADDATDAGSVKNARPQQPADQVIIKGPSKGAEEAQKEITALLLYLRENSHSATVSVAQSQIPQLIGSGGREMEKLRMETEALIDVPNARDVDASGRVQIKIKGSKEAVAKAKQQLEARAKVFDDTVTRNIDVDRKHHRALIGAGGKPRRSTIFGLRR
ncbi:hypothetical protein LTS18_010394 [Coniosporium uncinatum]|uniref:Uncharacterized protein n=1 Tax=Coniosporium uncinatum TaxID=93489 RepID=A0ACC3CZG8_9PEZI|nr:hypothetical protein LTS18_010394 [Coniosporium uncinatum]